MEGCHKDGASFVKLHKFTDHFRTSAKTGEGIEEAVRAAVKEVRSHKHVITMATHELTIFL